MRATCLSDKWDFFGQNMDERAGILDFFVISREKGHPTDIFCPYYIYSSLNGSDVFWTNYGHDDRGFS